MNRLLYCLDPGVSVLGYLKAKNLFMRYLIFYVTKWYINALGLFYFRSSQWYM
jgi:hypothetical protein